MPTLHWIGKDKVINHHRDVPFHVLDAQYTFSDFGLGMSGVGLLPKSDIPYPKYTEGVSDNKIIHGDNLLALKSLLPQYEGKIKCIYIDPPYNTGEESWIYNDNVNDPKIKKWLAQTVGKEGEDLSRHDKWLCMMYPRLKLLHQLLAKDGAIFISIDDNEQANLKLICDEIFGGNNFIAPLIWRSRQSVDARNKTGISNDHEYILVYQKKEFTPFKGIEKDLTKFSNPDNDFRGAWRSADLTGIANKEQRPNLHYDLIDTQTGIVYKCSEKGWRYDRNTMQKKIDEKRIIFPKNGLGRPRNKIFMNEMESDNKAFSTVILEMNTGQGTKMLKDIFEQDSFSFPKPVNLIEFLFSQITNSNDIILDSFAGSGTTAHAVLNLNKQDGGNRKFILIEMEDYAETITAERVKRVIKGYGNTEGVGGDFEYCTLGLPLFDEEGNLNENVGTDKIREYVFYTETEQYIKDQATTAAVENPHWLGIKDTTAYYFYYEPNQLTTLDMAFLQTVRTKADMYIVYADNTLLASDFLKSRNIIFKKIPRDVRRF